jgi:hypothetical protein
MRRDDEGAVRVAVRVPLAVLAYLRLRRLRLRSHEADDLKEPP